MLTAHDIRGLGYIIILVSYPDPIPYKERDLVTFGLTLGGSDNLRMYFRPPIGL